MLKGFMPAVFVLCTVASSTAMALKSDKDQPAVIDADEVDMDFQTGVRTYRGNVFVQQGTIRIKADEIVVYMKDGKLTEATAVGNPAIFRQRPDGKDEDVIGKGQHMRLDQGKNLVTLWDNASIKQGQDVLTGQKIDYNMLTQKMQVRGNERQTQQQHAAEGATGSGAAPAGKAGTAPVKQGSERPKMIIQPRSQNIPN